ncbi:hypothetical protein GCM10009853_032280 [Glycomyces scopariae]
MTIAKAVGFADDEESEGTLPPLLRRPHPVPDPEPLPKLRAAKKALLSNPHVSLDEHAVNAVTAGAVHPLQLQLMATASPANLLTEKPVAGGTLYQTAPHLRYLVLEVLPDFMNQRYAHKVPTAMDVEQHENLVSSYSTLEDSTTGKKLAVFTVRIRDRKALARAVQETLRRTYEAQGRENVYTDSVLQQGVKEPLTLFVMRVLFDDGSEDTFLVTSDGNSRLLSMWLARTGGDVDAAAAACVAAVIGPLERPGGRDSKARAAARRRAIELTQRVRKNLGTDEVTEETRREGHTVAFPATVVVGARDNKGNPLADLAMARDDLLANLHVRVTPWAPAAQNTQGMQRVYRHAINEGTIDADVHGVLSGALGPKEMHQRLGYPPHRLWSAALHQQVALTEPTGASIKALIKQEFGVGRARKEPISDRLAPTVLSAYRSLPLIDMAVRAFGNGGTFTDAVWKRHWELTKGEDPKAVLDGILEKALGRDSSAVAELTVLGGTAAMLDSLITRDRGSKLGATRENRKAPFRATPVALLDLLSKTDGGLRMLHSIASAHVDDDGTERPRQFHTKDRYLEGILVYDGQPVLDRVGTQPILEWEWDLVYRADPQRADLSIAELRAAELSGGQQDELEDEEVRQRRLLDQGVASAHRAAMALAKLSLKGHSEVFGSLESINDVRSTLDRIDEILLSYGPRKTADILVFDEDDEMEM